MKSSQQNQAQFISNSITQLSDVEIIPVRVRRLFLLFHRYIFTEPLDFGDNTSLVHISLEQH